MTAATVTNDVNGEALGLAARRAVRYARIRSVVFLALGLVSLNVARGTFGIPAPFSFWLQEQSGASFDITLNVGIFWFLAGVASAAVGVYQWVLGVRARWRLLLGLLVPLYVAASVAILLNPDAAHVRPANLTGVLAGSLELATPITLGAFAGIFAERSGMFNIAIEGQMLMGACAAAIVASITGSALGGVIGAMVVGLLVGLLLAWLAIQYKVDQIISGTVVNIGALGLTNYIYLRILAKNTDLNTPPSIEAIKIPVLSQIPILGPILFSGTPYLYLTLAIMVFLTYMIFRTRWGLRLRASGEYPSAAGTVGINVRRIRYSAMLYGGILAGIAGSYLSLSSAGSFQIGMSAGKGFIALAAMIFGAWHPVGAFGAALVFGFSDATQTLLSILGVDVPPQFLSSVPYIATIIVVAGLVGRVRGPAMAGRPYEQG